VAVLAASLSALNASSFQIAAAAGNIANVTTPGYDASRVDLATDPARGVRAAGVTKTGEPDLAGDYVTLIQAGTVYKANLKLIKAQSGVLGSVLDLVA
jgi:flagellar hook protein FlgE